MVTQDGLSLLAAVDSLGWGVCQEVLTKSWLGSDGNIWLIALLVLVVLSPGWWSTRWGRHLASSSVILVNGLGRSQTM